ncbi:hypothetical protein CAEBREN_19227 [Caenorhabditis brenneri]|uniref:Uncharacterized protein n=1 Tax=Caenorhabditis brenneri TaxID=135651 RepID=G0NY51_CAEBE|nr:hypothetical protein CAEBREN_19227 [Caenorhabditis brenneri]
MLSYKSLFALLVVIGMATALPIGGGGSGLPDLSEFLAILHEIQGAISELQKSVPGAPTVPSLPGVSVPVVPDVTLPTLPPLPVTLPVTLPPVDVPAVPSV